MTCLVDFFDQNSQSIINNGIVGQEESRGIGAGTLRILRMGMRKGPAEGTAAWKRREKSSGRFLDAASKERRNTGKPITISAEENHMAGT